METPYHKLFVGLHFLSVLFLSDLLVWNLGLHCLFCFRWCRPTDGFSWRLDTGALWDLRFRGRHPKCCRFPTVGGLVGTRLRTYLTATTRVCYLIGGQHSSLRRDRTR